MNDKYKMPYVNACIRAFAMRFSLTVQAAFRYLNRFKGIEFLDEFYDVEHLSSIVVRWHREHFQHVIYALYSSDTARARNKEIGKIQQS